MQVYTITHINGKNETINDWPRGTGVNQLVETFEASGFTTDWAGMHPICSKGNKTIEILREDLS